MSVGKICTRVTLTASADETARAVARRMAEHGVGSVVVVDDSGRPVGLVTDRDVAVRVVAPGLDPDRTEVAGFMSMPVHSVTEDAPIESALSGMAGAGVRRSVVTDSDGALVGILALDDVLELLVEEAEAVGALIRSQTGS